ncbi:MAG: type VI secretion system baseplate subunit TssG [Cellvibrionaceae bacterium]|nr:type VI secretion system baseplate subunit TssG [Cellvibrionaceae bacterium]
MASAYWRTNHRVEHLFHQQQVGWDFSQLVRLLLLSYSDQPLTDDQSLLETLANKIRFNSSLATDFPPGEVREIKTRDSNHAVDLSLVEGLLSATHGPLPEPFIEWIRKEKNNGDGAMAAFLNLFNNRLMALRYLIHRSTRPNLIDTSAANSAYGFLLEALSGAIFNRPVEAADLRLSGLLANNRLSLPVAKQLLRFSMGLNLSSVNCYQGGWLTVDQQDHSLLGNDSHCRLGKTAVLGKKVWDQQKSIEWVFAQLNWQQVKSLVPGGNRYREFSQLLNRITDCRCDSKVVLLLKETQIPEFYLQQKYGDNTAHESLSLGLTTVLPKAKNRLNDKAVIKIVFSIHSSNPNESE